MPVTTRYFVIDIWSRSFTELGQWACVFYVFYYVVVLIGAFDVCLWFKIYYIFIRLHYCTIKCCIIKCERRAEGCRWKDNILYEKFRRWHTVKQVLHSIIFCRKRCLSVSSQEVSCGHRNAHKSDVKTPKYPRLLRSVYVDSAGTVKHSGPWNRLGI